MGARRNFCKDAESNPSLSRSSLLFPFFCFSLPSFSILLFPLCCEAAPLNPTRRSRERCKLSQCVRRGPQTANATQVYFELVKCVWWRRFWFFLWEPRFCDWRKSSPAPCPCLVWYRDIMCFPLGKEWISFTDRNWLLELCYRTG